ncbi:SufB/SufD family protein [Sphingomonas sp. FW199]|uniref:SufB/SufD family protein n=1 Tax=Sphingomonas sp. FW199 TaxID=3400217 RepID=UPI003CF7D4A5
MTDALTLPTRRDESWRYADLDALARVWPLADAPEHIVVPAGEAQTLLIPALTPVDGVAVRAIQAELGEGARLNVQALVSGCDYGRLSISVRLSRGSHFELGGAILGSGEQTLEIVTDVYHVEPEATSNQTVRNVLSGRATGSYIGAVRVARHAQKTDGSQSVKSMLLDRTATANAVPQLEIFADDVKCAHGATVGELDKSGLFYMAARGIPPEVAKRLMLQAFLAEAFAAAGDAGEALDAAAQAQLEAML